METKWYRLLLSLIVYCLFFSTSFAQDPIKKLGNFEQYMQQLLKDWNCPGAAVGIVKNNKLIFAKGYGYRDFGNKLPVTPNTLYPIASNTKLFTCIAAGLLVEDGKLAWDQPIRNYVPTINFYNNELNNTITLRDMLSHRTGVSRHDLIWYKSDFSRKELFEKLQYLEPSQPLRQGFLYNNLMYASVGYSIELLTKQTWEAYLQQHVFDPLDMKSTVFSIADMKKQPDHGVPYNEKRDTTLLYEIPIYAETDGLGPAGSIVSNINDMAHWLVALMNNGNYEGKEVIPAAVIKATLEPSIPTLNYAQVKGYREILNPVYGMGRWTSSYRGHQLAFHGGDLPGFHSQISYMPQDSIGVIVFVIGDQSQPLYNIISYNVYERMLGMDQTPWNQRALKDHDASKKADREGRQKVATGRIPGTKPSHPLDDYAGRYSNPAYGNIDITRRDSSLQFALHKIVMPMIHYHYDRFDTPNDENDGLYSVNFLTNPQGDIGSLSISLDEGEAIFTRTADPTLSDPKTFELYTGKYEIGGTLFDISIKGEKLVVIFPGSPSIELIPYKPRIFRTKEFADFTIEFIVENGKTTGLKQKDPSGEYEAKKK